MKKPWMEVSQGRATRGFMEQAFSGHWHAAMHARKWPKAHVDCAGVIGFLKHFMSDSNTIHVSEIEKHMVYAAERFQRQ